MSRGADITTSPGDLYVIGGAEDKLQQRTVLRQFVGASGAGDAVLAVVPSASSLGVEIVKVYQTLFERLGAGKVKVLRPENRSQADDPGLTAELSSVTGIFMTGGNQLKLSGIVNGTRFGAAIRAAHRNGVVIGGTSAGASIMSSHMVAFGSGGATPKQRMTQLASGLGLLADCVIDQHFAQRNRYGRLLMLIAQSPNLLGIGVDEDTAGVVTDERWLEVIGRGVVTILDGRQIVTNAHEAKRTSALLVSGATLHVLPAGSKFDLTERTLIASTTQVDPAVQAERREARADLLQVAGDLAAESVSPTNLRRRRARSKP
jgi:cyanophycinase